MTKCSYVLHHQTYVKFRDIQKCVVVYRFTKKKTDSKIRVFHRKKKETNIYCEMNENGTCRHKSDTTRIKN